MELCNIDIHNILKILKKLSGKRPIFHSEADFQHALAWELHETCNNADIRLEKRFSINCFSDVYVDILFTEKENIAIELKYTTKELHTTINNESFSIKNHDAYDIRRYDFLLDIYRLQTLKRKGLINMGYAIFLTNATAYWNKPRKPNTNDKDFRIHENRTIQANKKLTWAKGTGSGTSKGRTMPLIFRNSYTFNWKSYSDVCKFCNNKKYCKFKYLLVEV